MGLAVWYLFVTVIRVVQTSIFQEVTDHCPRYLPTNVGEEIGVARPFSIGRESESVFVQTCEVCVPPSQRCCCVALPLAKTISNFVAMGRFVLMSVDGRISVFCHIVLPDLVARRRVGRPDRPNHRLPGHSALKNQDTASGRNGKPRISMWKNRRQPCRPVT